MLQGQSLSMLQRALVCLLSGLGVLSSLPFCPSIGTSLEPPAGACGSEVSQQWQGAVWCPEGADGKGWLVSGMAPESLLTFAWKCHAAASAEL